MYGPRMYFGPIDPGGEAERIRQSQPKRCHFCQEPLLTEPGDYELYLEEVGEFWSESLQQSVLAHPDCLPMGIDATLTGKDPEWKLA